MVGHSSALTPPLEGKAHSYARARRLQMGVSPLAPLPQITVSNTQAAAQGLLWKTDLEPSRLSLSLEESQGGRNILWASPLSLTVQSRKVGRSDSGQPTRARREGCPAPSGPEETFLPSGLPGVQRIRVFMVALVEKEPACQCRRHKRCGSDPWVESGWKDPLQEDTATHSRILAWRNPSTEEPGGPQSRGSHRVGHEMETP